MIRLVAVLFSDLFIRYWIFIVGLFHQFVSIGLLNMLFSWEYLSQFAILG